MFVQIVIFSFTANYKGLISYRFNDMIYSGTNRKDFSEEFLEFMNYINASTDENAGRAKSSKIKLIHRNVQNVRTSEKMGVKYMQLWEEKEYIREDARAEGLAEGRKEGQIEGVRNLMKNMQLTAEQAMEALGIPAEEREMYLEKIV